MLMKGRISKEGIHKSRRLVRGFQNEVPARQKQSLKAVVYQGEVGKVRIRSLADQLVVWNCQFLFLPGKLSDHVGLQTQNTCRPGLCSCSDPALYRYGYCSSISSARTTPSQRRGKWRPAKKSCHATPMNRLMGRHEIPSLSLDWFKHRHSTQ
jgi:hypothetical protein